MEYKIVSEKELESLLEEQRTEISGIEFKEINLIDANLKMAVFIDCKFTNCNLANVSLRNSVFRSVLFEGCNLMGINWSEVRTGSNYHFTNCKLDYDCFQNVDLRGIKFKNCSIREADFAGANLTKADFSGSLLSGTSFNNSNLEKADFRNAKGYFIDPKFTKLKQAKFSFPEAIALIHALGVEIDL